MKKILLLILLLFPFNVFGLDLYSKSAYLVNLTNDEVLYDYNKDEILPIASLTKIMTVIVSLENITDLNNTVIINRNDLIGLDGYVQIGLKEGDEISFKDLLYSTIMYSAADAANALCNHVFDSKDSFINKMNETANKLEMNNTNFSNPYGVDEDNYSTSYDLFLLLKYSLNNKNFYEIYTCKKYYVSLVNKNITGVIDFLINKNDIDTRNIKFKGSKSGFTTLSGLSLSTLTTIDDNNFILITLGAIGDQASNNHIKDQISILNEINSNYSNKVILEKNKLIDNIIYIKNNKSFNYEIRSKKNVEYFLKNNFDLKYLGTYYIGKTSINSNLKNNDKIGTIFIKNQNKIIYQEDIFFNKKYIVKDKKNYIRLFIFIIFCIIGLFIFKNKK